MSGQRTNERRASTLLSRLCLAALATMPAACTSIAHDGHRHAVASESRIAAALALWRPQVEQGLANGPGYGLTELEGLNAAIARGVEGRDAAALWDDEIKRHFRNRRKPMLDGLRAELRVIGPERVEQIIQAYTPRTAGDAAQARAAEQARAQYSTWNTFTYRWLRSEATCASLSSTPEAWRRLYPDRAPFTFERFGIDEPRLAEWCEVIVCEGVELMPQVWRALYPRGVPLGFRRFGTDQADLRAWCEERHRRSG